MENNTVSIRLGARFRLLRENYQRGASVSLWEDITAMAAEINRSGDQLLVAEYQQFVTSQLQVPLCA